MDALHHAFESNPALKARRSNVAATKQNLPLARAGYKPRLEASSEAGYQYEEGKRGAGREPFKRDLRPRSYSFQVTQPLFDGFRTRHAVEQALSQDHGAKESLRDTEQATIFNVVRAYLDVKSNRAILRFNRRQLGALEKQHALIGKLFGFREATVIEVAEVKVRVEAAKSGIALAQARLQRSEAEYRQIVGEHAPGALAAVHHIDAAIAPSLEEALDVAVLHHPSLLAARHAVDAARSQTKISRSEFYPRLNLTGSATQYFDESRKGDELFEGKVLARLRIPFYRGGEVIARTRRDALIAQQRQHEADVATDQVRALVRTVWSELEAARARVRAGGAQVVAADKALKGARAAYRIGERSNVNVLDAVRERLDAQINRASARRDRVLASFAVARAMGVLNLGSLEDIGLDAPADGEPARSHQIADIAPFQTVVRRPLGQARRSKPRLHRKSASAVALRKTTPPDWIAVARALRPTFAK